MDFNKQSQIAINKVIAEKLPEMLEAKASEMISSIVSDIFRSYGDTAKSIKAKLEETINVNLQELDLIDYNTLIAKTINDNLLQQVNLQPILDMTQDIIGFVNKKTITLQEIADIIIEASQEENDQEGEGEITFIVNENTKYNWIEVYADVDPDKKEYECTFKFILSSEGSREGQIFSFTYKDTCDDKAKEITPSKLVSLHGIEAKIFRLYSAQVKITDYNNTPDIYWSRWD
ncbi:hypothetical protein [Flavobacterium sp. HSC-61S13]|uniref:hypothetical protein n=1 Tax=Flavobacterium sp. HSC-61S13 TaxID=2910963 RepID=UPI0020A0F3BD|nr:hypothetical protein [Flavobacterium sp. HSC-61S13]MCP1996627.1 hypothetical protein [Flavobacterium sp. HSC-61S13]